MGKRFLRDLVFALGGIYIYGVSFCSAEESITITTYYPSPYGVYNELRLYPHVTSTVCSSTQEGLIYYDSAFRGLSVCRYNGVSYNWEAIGSTFHGKTLFASSGTFTVPSGVSKVWVSISGGGGGGGGGTSHAGGGGGGGAEAVMSRELNVTSGTTYTVTIGSGGSGGVYPNPGGNGQVSSFGALLTANGGSGGGPETGGLGGAGGASGGQGGTAGGGAADIGDHTGDGGGTIFGSGGGGGSKDYNNGTNGGGFGSGGGGCSQDACIGGNGASGFVLVEW